MAHSVDSLVGSRVASMSYIYIFIYYDIYIYLYTWTATELDFAASMVQFVVLPCHILFTSTSFSRCFGVCFTPLKTHQDGVKI